MGTPPTDPAVPGEHLATRGGVAEDEQARLVLAERPLRPGTSLEGTSRFGDAVWDLTPALLQAHHGHARLDFAAVLAPLRLARQREPDEELAAPLVRHVEQ